MAVDAHKNFSYSHVATAPSPATSGTSLVVTAGQGTIFPTVPFNATIWPAGVQPLTTNAEIVRVTAISTDTFTITRAQESTSARTVIVGDQIAATITSKVITDAEASPTTDVQVFTADGTWTKPAGAKMVLVVAIGAAGSGGGGQSDVAGTNRAGASGGGGGGTTTRWLRASTLGTSETVTVATAPAGGAAETNGTDGGNSTFGTHVTGFGGKKGNGTSTTNNTGASGGGIAITTLAVAPGEFAASSGICADRGGAGSGVATNGASATSGSSLYGGSGGGAGGGFDSANNSRVSTAGGLSGTVIVGGGGAGGAAGGTNPGGTGADGSGDDTCGSGGGGGGNNAAGLAGDGGPGGTPAGGGGGGGSGLTGGAGGSGGRGEVRVFTFF